MNWLSFDVKLMRLTEDEVSTNYIGPPRLTRFERARVIGARALQIALGAPVLITPPKNMVKPIDIAVLELDAGVLPITMRRKHPDGSYVDIPLQAISKGEEKAKPKPKK